MRTACSTRMRVVTGGVGWEPGGDDAPCLVAVGDDQAPLADGGESLAEPVLVFGAAQSHE
ncbi:hypothetical protein BANAN_04130 [Bifidobacterium animalis subsp. animalis ATCC 25527]|nr:hypothetical protein BANAN_04130 [Bifidobacterium animalis subsp. animalis ATCC 25527]